MRVAEVRGLASSTDTERPERKKKTYNKITSKRVKRSIFQFLEFLVCHEGMLELAAEIDAEIGPPPGQVRGGRRRDYVVMDIVVFDVARWFFRTYVAVEENLADPLEWARLRLANRRAHPNRPDLRLSETPPTRGQHWRFRKDHLTEEMKERVRDGLRTLAVQAGIEVGILPAIAHDSWTNPEHFLVGDGLYLPALFKTPAWKATDPATGTTKRTDPEARPYQGYDSNKVGSVGYTAINISGRADDRRKRIVFDCDLKPGGTEPDLSTSPKSEADIATDLYLGLVADYKEEMETNRGLGYDMAMRSVNIDRIQDAGKMAPTKIPYNHKGAPTEITVGEQNFKTVTGRKEEHVVYGVNGTPCIIMPDGTGELWFVPLRRVQTKRTKRESGKFVFHGIWEIRKSKTSLQTQIVPKRLEKATTIIRHNSKEKERDPGPGKRHSRRTIGLSIIPESDPAFEIPNGKRQDSESHNSDIKARLRYERCPTTTRKNVHFTLLTNQLRTIITALIAHSQNNHATLTRFYGNHKPQSRGSPIDLDKLDEALAA
ncbi:hypothetical protein [Candidatus Poriferisocius sp.]|uniref:hypothetical protein n=1 Tax=Candidatus Poriferisocius sp. TaxID=3101276 RepID=UPI003B012640